ELISVRHTDLYIDGTWHPASDGQRIEVTDPATGEAISTVASASVQDALEAVAAAHQAFRGWAARPPRERAEILRKAFELMIRDRDKLAELMVRENGKPLNEARGEVVYAAEFFRWFSEEAVRNIGSVSIAPSGANRIMVEHQPIGVSLLVTPWNFPAAMATRKIGPALAAGCTVILKPASETPLSALAIADLLEQGGVTGWIGARHERQGQAGTQRSRAAENARPGRGSGRSRRPRADRRQGAQPAGVLRAGDRAEQRPTRRAQPRGRDLRADRADRA